MRVLTVLSCWGLFISATAVGVHASTLEPDMARSSVVHGMGGHAQLVRMPRPWSITTAPGDAVLRSDGAWGGLYLIQRGPRPLSLGLVTADAPQGCSVGYCAHNGYWNLDSNAPVSKTGPGGPLRFSYPAGTYWLYLLGASEPASPSASD